MNKNFDDILAWKFRLNFSYLSHEKDFSVIQALTAKTWMVKKKI